MQPYSPIVLLDRIWLTARSGHTPVSIAKVHLLIPPNIMTALKELSGSIISTGKLARHPQTIDGCQQCRNFVIWGPGANIHYGAPFFSTKRSTGLLFCSTGIIAFLWGFLTTPCYRNISIESFDILQHSKELQ